MSQVDDVLAALADPMRRRILDLVAAKGAASASALAAELPVSRQAIVKHLGVLEKAELVASERAGRENNFSVRSDALDATASWMASLASQWDQRLAAIKKIAES
ncbi:metalloregulator ArsR/SmtB family transcription factor [Lentzea sp. BCCO 10_0798]|uniref:Metalloregulator ArsR/SmtB family transcription factor n=1 Tax=Lentzea kristufekii TaxID=3095430 RepID=A0ABU4TWZ4_9PSEU|nr:metalloregulator ArsR/SmtB family transcription factor [Lentzea sp. BCCO 10_0798]MDX8052833.1 metalloregulator ArsR/SmtB family transcription factor [Lentzea sp. BCCO 10_0798]